MRKTGRIMAAVIVLAMALSVLFTGCDSGSAPDMKISIDGKEFQLGCQVSEFLDAGFKLASMDDKARIITEYPDVAARTLVQNSMYLFKDGEATHVAVFAMNKTVNTATLDQCMVYAFKYDCGNYSSNVSQTPRFKVLFDGIDFRFTERPTVMSSLEGKGFKFKDSDKQAFLNSGNSDSYISVTNSNGSVLTVYSNYNSNTGDSTVNGFEAKLSVKYDTIDG